jgi:DNA-binding transcriptional regulator PaaX
MILGKYKYYFKKPRSEITKDIMKWLLVSGTIVVAAQSPYFIINFLRNYQTWKKYPKKKVGDTFSNLRKQGFLEIERKENQIYIRLTKEGKERAGIFQINDLKIKKPRKWDKKWRIVIFDISQLKKNYREAFRGKLKECGFYCLQKSVWVYPFECRAEIELLRDFFGLSEDELRLIVAERIGNDNKLKEIFKLTEN